LVKQGTATIMISVPSKWCKANNLNKGDEVDVEESENDLRISTSEITKQKKETMISINEENQKELRNILTHLYRKGFDKITIENVSIQSMRNIRNIVEKLLLGFEITEKNGSQCMIENISEPSEGKYGAMLNKVFLIMRESFEMLEEDFETGKLQNLQEMEEIKIQQDRLILFCRRLLIGSYAGENMALEWELLTFLTHIQHAVFYLYKFASENRIKPESQMYSLIKSLNEYFRLLYGVYRNKNIRLIHKINYLKDSYQFGKCIEAIEKGKGKNAVVYSYIRELFRLIQLGTSPLLGEILEENRSKS